MPFRLNPFTRKLDIIDVTAIPPGTVATITGDSGGAVSPDGSNNINLFSDDSTANNANGVTVIGVPASNQLTVTLTNRLTGTASSVNAANADIITFALGASAAVYRFDFMVVGRDTGTGNGVGYHLFASVRTDGASATLIQTPFTDNDEDTALTAATLNLVMSGNSVILRANGVAGQTISYLATGTYVVV